MNVMPYIVKFRPGKNLVQLGLVLATLLGLMASPSQCYASVDRPVLENSRYRIQVQEDGSLLVSRLDTVAVRFSPRFIVMRSDVDPKMGLRRISIKRAKYDVMTWEIAGIDSESTLVNVDASVSAGDGLDPSVLEGSLKNRTANYFNAAVHETVLAYKASVSGRTISWSFPESDRYVLAAEVQLPQGDDPPVLSFHFRPSSAGWYSVGYTGAPEADLDSIDELWQPLIWQEKRFPQVPYLTLAFRCTLPTALVSTDGLTVGVVADSAELPFQPLPRPENSRFGVMVRNAEGRVQPLIFAPVLGSADSKFDEGQAYSFKAHLVVNPGGVNDAYESIARDLFGFRDFRRNTTFSLNDTINNMIAYGMSRYSRFNADLRGCAYITDVPGAVKNVSSLHPLSAALITDSPDIYSQRALPIIEYLISREKFLFALDPEQTIQSPSWKLLGPSAPVEELAALYAISRGHSSVFLQLANLTIDQQRKLNLDVEDMPRSWPKLLALYQATGDPELLAETIRRADIYLDARIKTPQTDFSDPYSSGMFFWTSYAPMFIELTELYEETGERRYLDAAVESAHRFAQFVWMCPQVPDQDIVVNEGGKVPHYWYLKSKGHTQMEASEAKIPAWEVSEIGLTCESSGTSAGHRAIFPASFAPVMLRLASYTGDQFLHDIARAAIVGRYENFPGYHINTARTNIYMQRDYPLREHEELSYNSFHYNHVWPHIAILFDYLISDVFYRSDQQIHFPARYSPGYAYLRGKIYGDRPGEFYEDKNVRLWMPKGLVQIDNPQINYLAAEGNDQLYLALTNQSAETQDVTVTLSADVAGLAVDSDNPVRVWYDNQESELMHFRGNTVSVSVSPSGITALAIEGVSPVRKIALHQTAPATHGQPLTRLDFCGTHAMIIDIAPGFVSAYVYLQETFESIKEARLNYRVGDLWLSMVDAKYPYEFTVELQDSEGPFEFFIEAVYLNGSIDKSETAILER